MFKLMLFLVMVSGFILGPPSETSAYDGPVPHSTAACLSEEMIIHLSTIALTRRIILGDFPPGLCFPFRRLIDWSVIPALQAISRPQKDYEGDWFAPYKVTTSSSGSVFYVLVYFAKGDKFLKIGGVRA